MWAHKTHFQGTYIAAALVSPPHAHSMAGTAANHALHVRKPSQAMRNESLSLNTLSCLAKSWRNFCRSCSSYRANGNSLTECVKSTQHFFECGVLAAEADQAAKRFRCRLRTPTARFGAEQPSTRLFQSPNNSSRHFSPGGDFVVAPAALSYLSQ